MNRIIKKLISGLTTFTLLISTIGVIPAIADDPPAGGGGGASTKSTLTVEYFGVGNAPAAEGKKVGNLNSDNTAAGNNHFWIGVGLDKLKNIPMFTDGVYSLEMAFEYDPDFVRPNAATTGTKDEKEDAWNEELVAANIGNGKLWGSDYIIESTYETDLDTTSDRADKDKLTSERSEWKMCTVCVTLTADNANPRFKDINTEDKEYLLYIPFTLIDVPAEGADDPNPTVISFIRGDETFDVGAGTDGQTSSANWCETKNQNEANNLKTYIDFSGDIKLFGLSTPITDITPLRNEPKIGEDGEIEKDDDDKEIMQDKDYPLSQSYDPELLGEGFNADVEEYWLSISNLPNNLQLRMAADEKPTVKVNGTAVTVNNGVDTGTFLTEAFKLNELDKDVNDGFNNTVTVEAGGRTYTIYIRRCLQPKIILNYGNSPYGEIMKTDWDVAKKEKAKEEFNKGHKYATGYIPPAASEYAALNPNANTLGRYAFRAWVDVNNPASPGDEANKLIEDPSINMDRNDYAIFVYNGEPFVDPGFVATDALGEPVTKLDRSITIQQMSATLSLDDNNQTTKTIDTALKDTPSDCLITEITPKFSLNPANPDENVYKTRPDNYEMSYTFTDSTTGEIVKVIRNVIVLQLLGDIDCNDLSVASDKSVITKCVKGIDNVYTSTKQSSRRIILYKIGDCDGNDLVVASDKSIITKFIKSNKSCGQYVMLPKSN